MAMKFGAALTILAVAMSTSMFGIAMANKNLTGTAGIWNRTEDYWGYWHKNASQDAAKRTVVGGSEKWHYKNLTGTAGNWNRTEDYWGYWHKKANQDAAKRIVVGGSEKWHFGFNYTDWAIKNGPFYLNDTLVFKYDPPNDTTFPHSVYLLPNFWSFQKCDLRRAKKIGEVTAGGGEGFDYVLKRWQPYYFACGERNGFHCNSGMMKFAVWPLVRRYY